MAVQKIRGRQTYVQGIQIGTSGAKLDVVKKVALAKAYGNIDPNATTLVPIALAGLAATDILLANGYPTGLNDDLLFLGVGYAAAGTAQVAIYNPTAGTINQSGTVTLNALQISITT
jgi:hypothetical protein